MGFELVSHERTKGKKPSVAFLGRETAQKAAEFHASFPMYQKTPLVDLTALSKHLGVKGVFVKDESYRFGLNAFKVLGGSYAIGTYIADKLELDINQLSYEQMISEEVRSKIGELTFISATDGNHGRGVAWTANQLRQNCVIHMPKGSASERLDNIRAEGARADITDLNYDDAVRLSDQEAKENGWILVQDTSWPGYERIPVSIMQGYTTMACEMLEQLQEIKPTHIFLQAGVGAFATAMTGFFRDVYGENGPIITIVEPNEAACIYKTMKAADGAIHPVTGDMQTIMAGLACGEPVTVGIEILRHYCDHFISCPDYVAAEGMRVLSSPVNGDRRIISGESGAAGFGLFYEAMTNESCGWIKEALQLTEDSVILCISTEGDTDQKNYEKIIWDGAYPRP
ncbi:MAG: diaminopropionate ammonia-lyase [Lachnospiraceae bacterium]